MVKRGAALFLIPSQPHPQHQHHVPHHNNTRAQRLPRHHQPEPVSRLILMIRAHHAREKCGYWAISNCTFFCLTGGGLGLLLQQQRLHTKAQHKMMMATPPMPITIKYSVSIISGGGGPGGGGIDGDGGGIDGRGGLGGAGPPGGVDGGNGGVLGGATQSGPKASPQMHTPLWQ